MGTTTGRQPKTCLRQRSGTASCSCKTSKSAPHIAASISVAPPTITFGRALLRAIGGPRASERRSGARSTRSPGCGSRPEGALPAPREGFGAPCRRRPSPGPPAKSLRGPRSRSPSRPQRQQRPSPRGRPGGHGEGGVLARRSGGAGRASGRDPNGA